MVGWIIWTFLIIRSYKFSSSSSSCTLNLTTENGPKKEPNTYIKTKNERIEKRRYDHNRTSIILFGTPCTQARASKTSKAPYTYTTKTDMQQKPKTNTPVFAIFSPILHKTLFIRNVTFFHMLQRNLT